MKIIHVILAVFISSFSNAQTSFENYSLKDIGSVSIPSSMELQSGNYKKLAEKYQEEQSKKLGYEISGNHIVFQQKGLNGGNKSSSNSYARVMLETTIGNPGDYEKLSIKLSATKEELDQLSTQIKSQNEESLRNIGIKIISWYGVQIISVNGKPALKYSYLRQLNDNPYVFVNVYQFQNYDRMYSLIMSYRQQDASTWKDLYVKILNSFTIINIK